MGSEMCIRDREQKQQVQQAVTEAAKQKGNEVLQQAVSGTKPQDIIDNILTGKKDTTKKQSAEPTKPQDMLNRILSPEKDTTNSKVKADSTKAAQDLLQDKLQGLFKKKKRN